MSKKDDANLSESTEDHNNNTTMTSSVSDSTNYKQTSETTSDLSYKDNNLATGSPNGSSTNDSFDDSSNQKDPFASEPYVQDRAYSNSGQATRGLTGNYFCFDCGAIMTTLEDKYQHSLIEQERHKKQGDSEH